MCLSSFFSYFLPGHYPVMAEDKNQKRRNGHFLSAFLCQVRLPLSSGEAQNSNMFDDLLVKAYLKSHPEQKEFREILRDNPESCLKVLLSDLQLLGESEKTVAGTSGRFMFEEHGPSFLLLSPRDLDKKTINQLIKLPDILSNAFQCDLPANYRVERVVDYLLYNLLICHYVHQVARNANLNLPLDNLAHWYPINKNDPNLCYVD